MRNNSVIRQTDGRTDRLTDSFAITNAALHYVARPKIWTVDKGEVLLSDIF